MDRCLSVVRLVFYAVRYKTGFDRSLEALVFLCHLWRGIFGTPHSSMRITRSNGPGLPFLELIVVCESAQGEGVSSIPRPSAHCDFWCCLCNVAFALYSHPQQKRIAWHMSHLQGTIAYLGR